jgi:hypothetical protein
MNARRIPTAGKRSERGYALLVVIFLMTLLLISTTVIAPNILTEGRREKEKDMIWRGKQYTRGVKLYYRKMGRFPSNLDDLTKPKLGSLRFMRQAYKDPMNKDDGSWRFIYVGPGGQLIGSLKPPQQNLTLPQAGGIGTPASALNGPNAPAQPGGTGLPGLGGTQPGGAQSGTTPPGTTGAPVSADQGTPGSYGRYSYYHRGEHHRRGEQDQQVFHHRLRESQKLSPLRIHLGSLEGQCDRRATGLADGNGIGPACRPATWGTRDKSL